MADPRGSAPSWLPRLIPAATFVAGLLLGGIGVAVSQGDDGDEPGSSPSTTGATPGESVTSDIQVTIPAACRDAADKAQEATDLLRDAVTAVRDREPQTLVDVLRSLEQVDADLRSLADDCSQVEVD